MNKITTYIFVSIFLLSIFVTGCTTNSDSHSNLFTYKGSYVGDNSAIANIVRQLPQHDNFKEMALQTKKEPYGVKLVYEKMNDENAKKVIINNATFIFALVKNAEWVTFDLGNEKYTLTREQLENWYGKDLETYKNKNDLRHLIEKNLNDKNKIERLF